MLTSRDERDEPLPSSTSRDDSTELVEVREGAVFEERATRIS
jgi:hypothetical protein